MAACLVTGGAGFFGSHLTHALVDRGHSVRVLDNFCTGSQAALADLGERIELIPGDVGIYADVHRATRGTELVFHCAAVGHHRDARTSPIDIHRCCATGTLHVLQAANDLGCRRVVYISTGHVYGWPTGSPVNEDDPTQPQSNYAASKLAGEFHCSAFTRTYGLSTVRLRFFNLCGPRQRGQSIYADELSRLLAAMLAGRPPLIFGDGQEGQELLHVEDAVHAALLAADTDRLASRVYNIARGRCTTTLEMVAVLNQLLGTRSEPVMGGSRLALALNFQADISRAEAELGFCPSTGLAQALRHCVDYYAAHQDELGGLVEFIGPRE